MLEFEVTFGNVPHEKGLKLAVVLGKVLRRLAVLSRELLLLKIMIIIDRSENGIGHERGPVIDHSTALVKNNTINGS